MILNGVLVRDLTSQSYPYLDFIRIKRKNDISFNKFQAGVIKPDASFEEIQRGGYQLLGKYEMTQDARLNFTLGNVPCRI